MNILKNQNTGEERPLIRCGITACNKVIHIGDEMGYDKNYDVFCESCSNDLFVARGQIDDDWISGDEGWEEIEDPADRDDRHYHEEQDHIAMEKAKVDQKVHNHPLGTGFAHKDNKETK